MNPITENLYSFPINLPQNPLKWLNCYVIKGRPGERNLLIDTGFNRPECLSDLLRGMEELALRPEETDVFFTHFHSDHTGNAGALQSRGCRLFMSGVDRDAIRGFDREAANRRMLSEGMLPDVLEDVVTNNPGRKYISDPYDAEPLAEGDILSCGGYRLECILTPGHTPGHMCLYDRERQLFFLGDHVLFDITPNITFWTIMEDSLGSYLKSLEKIMDLPVSLALPAHRHTGRVSMRERIEELFRHHAFRLGEAERIVREQPGIHAYDIAGQMTWSIRAKNWDDFPPGQKWFAVGEALSHLDHLVLQGRVVRETAADGRVTYHA